MLGKLNSEKFKEVHSTIVCKMTDIKPKFMDSTILYGLTSKEMMALYGLMRKEKILVD